MAKAYALRWSATGVIVVKECYTDLERAKRHMKHANKHLSWRHKLLGHRWELETLKVKEGKKP